MRQKLWVMTTGAPDTQRGTRTEPPSEGGGPGTGLSGEPAPTPSTPQINPTRLIFS